MTRLVHFTRIKDSPVHNIPTTIPMALLKNILGKTGSTSKMINTIKIRITIKRVTDMVRHKTEAIPISKMEAIEIPKKQLVRTMGLGIMALLYREGGLKSETLSRTMYLSIKPSISRTPIDKSQNINRINTNKESHGTQTKTEEGVTETTSTKMWVDITRSSIKTSNKWIIGLPVEIHGNYSIKVQEITGEVTSSRFSAKTIPMKKEINLAALTVVILILMTLIIKESQMKDTLIPVWTSMKLLFIASKINTMMKKTTRMNFRTSMTTSAVSLSTTCFKETMVSSYEAKSLYN
jgi:hypothetical protein